MGKTQFETPGYSRVGRSLPTAVLLALATSAPVLFAQPAVQVKESPQQLVREVVYNELHDHDSHGYWRYWVRQSTSTGAQMAEVVETKAGPIKRVVLSNGQPLTPGNSQVEEAKLDELASSPNEQASHRQAYAEDEQRVHRIMAMLPDAFCFQDMGEANGVRHLRFQPNPGYSAHTVEARVFHALNGDLWIDTRMKRLTRIDGRMSQDLTFGFGLLARVDHGSWFRMERIQVSPTEWKTAMLEVHISGHAVVFKNIAHETSEVRGGFKAVPADLTVAQSVHLLEQTDPEVAAEAVPAMLIHGQ